MVDPVVAPRMQHAGPCQRDIPANMGNTNLRPSSVHTCIYFALSLSHSPVLVLLLALTFSHSLTHSPFVHSPEF